MANPRIDQPHDKHTPNQWPSIPMREHQSSHASNSSRIDVAMPVTFTNRGGDADAGDVGEVVASMKVGVPDRGAELPIWRSNRGDEVEGGAE